MEEGNLTIGQKVINNIDALTAENPHADDPRFMQANQYNHCCLRYTMFCRCARELGADNTRCKYQYYRAQVACTQDQVEDWDDKRTRGACYLDVMPDRSTLHMKEWVIYRKVLHFSNKFLQVKTKNITKSICNLLKGMCMCLYSLGQIYMYINIIIYVFVKYTP